MRTAMSASRRSRLVSSLEATSSISISGWARCKRERTAGSSQVAATWLVRHADDAARRGAGARQPARHGERGVVHPPRRVGDRQRRAGRRDAAAGALEERCAELCLELGDVAADRRLLRAEALGRRGHAARVEDGEKAPHQGPVEAAARVRSHAKVYVFHAESGIACAARRAHTSRHRPQRFARTHHDIRTPPASAAERTVLVLGANGRFGLAAAQAFAAAGWRVLAQVRRDAAPGMPAAAELVRAPLAALAEGEALTPLPKASVVVHGSIRSTRAGTKRHCRPRAPAWTSPSVSAPASCCPATSTTSARRCPRSSTKRRRSGRRPTRARSAPRWSASSKRRAAAGRLRATVITAGDFFGAGSGSWFDLVVVRSIANGKLVYPGDPALVHAWAYLPDLARAFVAVAGLRTSRRSSASRSRAIR